MRKLILIAAAAFALAAARPALAQQGTYQPFTQPSGAEVPAFVMLCATGTGRLALPCGALSSPFYVFGMPFTRLHSAPIRLKDIGAAPKSFQITRPAGATTYRIVNPCDVDIRLLGTMNATDQVTEDTGVLYLARTEATMGTSKPNFISAMTVGTPSDTCTPEMHYGMGGG
jgi:hypothetical protein